MLLILMMGLMMGLMMVVWCVVVMSLAGYFGTPQFLVGLGRAIWTRLTK